MAKPARARPAYACARAHTHSHTHTSSLLVTLVGVTKKGADLLSELGTLKLSKRIMQNKIQPPKGKQDNFMWKPECMNQGGHQANLGVFLISPKLQVRANKQTKKPLLI